MDRDKLILTFLGRNISGEFKREKIDGDASFRCYERIIDKKTSYILMDAPPEKEELKPFIKVTKILKELNLKPPTILAEDINNGFLLLEDLGDDKLTSILNNQFYNEVEFYRNTVNVLIHIYKETIDKKIDLPKYSDDILLREANLFTEWYLPLFENLEDTKLQDIKSQFEDLVKTLCNKLNYPNNTLILRDFHADNLLYLPDEKGLKQIALIDYQDALIGNPTYDLLSLLEDARRNVNKFIQADMIKYFLFEIAETERKEDFLSDYNILSAIRNLKILGIFSRLKVRDKKDNYLKYIPQVKQYLNKNLEHNELNELKLFLEKICKTL